MFETEKFDNSLTKFIWYFIKPNKSKFYILATLMVLCGIVPSIDSYIIKFVTDNLTKDPKFDIKNGMLLAFFYGIWWETVNFLFRFYDIIVMRTFPDLKIQISKYMYDFLSLRSLENTHKNLVGDLSNKISDMSRSVILIIEIITENILQRASTALCAIITMYTIHPYFAVVLILWVLFFLLINYAFMAKILENSEDYAHARSFCSGKMVDALHNILSVKLFARTRFESEYINNYLVTSKVKDTKLHKIMLILSWIEGTSCSVMIGFILFFLSYLHSLNKVTIGDYVLIISLSLVVCESMWQLTRCIADLNDEAGICKQALKIFDNGKLEDQDETKPNIQITKGVIEFHNVTFKYARKNNIFENKSIKINGGQKIGLVGYSGSGKTTFVSLIIRLFDVHSGNILIDSQSIQDVNLNSLRENIAFIPQDPLLFHRSIMENIRYGKIDASDEEVIKAAKMAHAHDFIMATENGYNTIVGTKNTSLSGGQKQRIAIARCFLKNAPILVLDEATSALDTKTEKYIKESLKQLMEGKTTLIIAHRLSTLLSMDRILVFHEGSIIEDGSHDELVEKSGVYSELWQSQIGGMLRDLKD